MLAVMGGGRGLTVRRDARALGALLGAAGGAGQVLLYSIPEGSLLHSFEAPDNEITATSQVPPPMSRIIVPRGSCT